jgi:hypothetical protein
MRRERLSVSSGDDVSKIRSLNIWMWVGNDILMEFKDILRQRALGEPDALVNITKDSEFIVKITILCRLPTQSQNYLRFMRISIGTSYGGSGFVDHRLPVRKS